jgi:hypothetical protein
MADAKPGKVTEVTPIENDGPTGQGIVPETATASVPTAERPGLEKESAPEPLLLDFLSWLVTNPQGVLVPAGGRKFAPLRKIKNQVTVYKFVNQMMKQWLEENGHVVKGHRLRG